MRTVATIALTILTTLAVVRMVAPEPVIPQCAAEDMVIVGTDYRADGWHGPYRCVHIDSL